MSRQPKKAPPGAVSELQHRLAKWREQRPKPGCRIPEKFWKEATRLGRDFGVSLVSRYLKMDYHGLKQRVLELSEPEQRPKRGFVEVRMETASSVSSIGGVVTEIEIYKGRDTAMRIRQSGSVGTDLSELVTNFMRASY